MRFTNTTDFSAHLFRGEIREREMLATVVVRATFGLGPDGTLGDLLAPIAPILGEDDELPDLRLPSERVPSRPGLNVWVQGHVRPPTPTRTVLVRLAVDHAAHALVVSGERFWRDATSFTEPAILTEIPLDYTRAYGGRFESDSSEMVHPLNPDGRGFAATVSSAITCPLPNIEWADARIRTRDDQPPIAGFAPLQTGSPMHIAEATRADPSVPGGLRITRKAFCCANPRLVFEGSGSGSRITLSGMAERPTSFVVPSFPVVARVVLGTQRHALVPKVDTVGIAHDQRTATISARTSFRYRVVPHQVRTVTLHTAPGMAGL